LGYGTRRKNGEPQYRLNQSHTNLHCRETPSLVARIPSISHEFL